MLQKVLIISLFLVAAVYTQNTDKYEPNNDFSSAYPISFGDSVVQNASIYGSDTVVTDPFLSDIDYYRIALDSGKIVQILLFPDDGNPCFNPRAYMAYQLFDSSKVQIFSNFANQCPVKGKYIPGYVVTKTGTYYLRVQKTGKWDELTTNYGISVYLRDNNNIFTVLSPNGGETFSCEERVTVKLQFDPTLTEYYDQVAMQYSIDNGLSWRNDWSLEYLHDSTTSIHIYSWIIPHLKYRTDQALLRVMLSNLQNSSFGFSNGTFTILASKNDEYEPNDDFSTARVITLGDSVVKNGIVMKGYSDRDTGVIDTTLTDVDFFKIYLEAGKLVSISDISPIVYRDREYDHNVTIPAFIRLYDASKNLIGMGLNRVLTSGISHSGFYYCEIVPGEEDRYWNRYWLSIHQSDPVSIVSPKGGEHFQAGQRVQISWTSDSRFKYFNLYYSLNNGTSWKLFDIFYDSTYSSSWVIPAFKTRTDQALVKVEINDVVNQLSAISSNPFTILQISADAYEPNNDQTSAYPIALGDSIIKNATLFIYEDSTIIDSNSMYAFSDTDFYKIYLNSEKLVYIHNWIDTADAGFLKPKYALHNDDPYSGVSLDLISNQNHCPTEDRFYYIKQSDVYYLKVNPNNRDVGGYTKYGFSLKTMDVFASRSFILDTEFDSSASTYRGKYTDAFTKLTFECLQEKNNFFEIRTIFLSPDDFSPVTDELLKVKAFAVFCDNHPGNQRGTDISIPYNPADLNGHPEKSLAVACQDFTISDQLNIIPGTIDTINHRITVNVPYLQSSIFQLYIKGNNSSVIDFSKNAPVSGITTRYFGSQKKLAVQFHVPGVEHAELRLYNTLGKCVQKTTLRTGSRNSTYLWDLNGLSNGKYVFSMKAGKYRSQKTLLVLY